MICATSGKLPPSITPPPPPSSSLPGSPCCTLPFPRLQSTRRANDPCIAPLEMLLDAVPAEYPSMRDFQRSKRRQVLLLEQGLLNHPARVGLQAAISGGARSAKANKGAGGGGGDDQKRTKLKKLLAELQTGQKDILEASVKAELKEAVNAVADMSFPGAGSGQHWADGWPLNCRLYAVLLGAVFTGGREATIVEEVEDVLGVVGRTWPVLGITPLVHRIVFAWLFLRQYVASGQKQDVMLVAADFQVSWGGQGRGLQEGMDREGGVRRFS